MQTNFVEIPGFSGLFEEISLHAIFPRQIAIVRRIFATPIVCNGPIFRVIFRGTRWFPAIFCTTIRSPWKFVANFPGKIWAFLRKVRSDENMKLASQFLCCAGVTLGGSAFPYSSCKLINQLLLKTYRVSLQEKLKSGLDPKSKKQCSLFFEKVDSLAEIRAIRYVNAMYVV